MIKVRFSLVLLFITVLPATIVLGQANSPQNVSPDAKAERDAAGDQPGDPGPLATGLSPAVKRKAVLAAMKKVAVTFAPGTGWPSALVSFTRTAFDPVCSGDGSVLKSIATRSAGLFMAAVAAASAGGGVNDPIAACNCDSESTRKLAELTMRSPAFKPVRTTM